MNINQLYEDLQAFIFEFGPKILGAIVVWIIGSWIIKLAVKALKKIFERTKLDKSLKPFILSLSGITMKLLLGHQRLGNAGGRNDFFYSDTGCSRLGHRDGLEWNASELCRRSHDPGV